MSISVILGHCIVCSNIYSTKENAIDFVHWSYNNNNVCMFVSNVVYLLFSVLHLKGVKFNLKEEGDILLIYCPE